MAVKIKLLNQTDSESVSFQVEGEDRQPLGRATVDQRHMETLYPNCPLMIRIRVEGEERGLDALYGAAVARAQLMATQAGAAAHIYAECDPNDRISQSILKILGFRGDDALVRMTRNLSDLNSFRSLPSDMVLVRDRLEDAREQQYFLDRYNHFFAENMTPVMLKALMAKSGFERLLIAAPGGLASEMLICEENGMGAIKTLMPLPAYRRQGLASFLLETVRESWFARGITKSAANVRRLLPDAEHLFANHAYRAGDVLLYYPGIDFFAFVR